MRTVTEPVGEGRRRGMRFIYIRIHHLLVYHYQYTTGRSKVIRTDRARMSIDEMVFLLSFALFSQSN